MDQICSLFQLKNDIAFIDENLNEKKLGASIEIKGIKGSDGRKYFLDLMRLSPRDINFNDYCHGCCLIRKELIENY